MQGYFSFFRKIVIAQLKKRLFCRKGKLGFPIKKKKERKEKEGRLEREKKTYPLLQKLEIMHSSFLLISCSIEILG
jgi:hypothetical protein